jgi:hypothetical protein
MSEPTMKRFEVIAACERYEIPAADHREFCRLVRWGRMSDGFYVRLHCLKHYQNCLDEILGIVAQRGVAGRNAA